MLVLKSRIQVWKTASQIKQLDSGGSAHLSDHPKSTTHPPTIHPPTHLPSRPPTQFSNPPGCRGEGDQLDRPVRDPALRAGPWG